MYNGRLTVNFIETKRVDGSEYKIGPGQMRVIHGSMDYNDQVATVTGGAGDGTYPTITGDVSPGDNGVWYLIIDYGTNNTCWLDTVMTTKQQYITRVFGNDGDIDGFDEDYVELNFANLPPNIDDVHALEVNLVNSPARTSSVTCTSLTNVSTVSTAAYGWLAAAGYVGGFTEGDLARIAKIQLVFDDNATESAFPDTSQWQLTHLKLGPYTFAAGQWGGYDLSNTRYQITFGDQVNWQGGRDLYYAKNAGATSWCPYELKAYCKYIAVGTAVPKCYVYLYEPDGSISATAVINRTISFSTS